MMSCVSERTSALSILQNTHSRTNDTYSRPIHTLYKKRTSNEQTSAFKSTTVLSLDETNNTSNVQLKLQEYSQC